MRAYGFGLVGALVVLGACGGPQAVVREVPQAKEGGRCELEKVGPSPFKNPEATHFLVADFYGGEPGSGPNFSQTVTEQVSAELKRFRDEVLSNREKFNVEVPEGSLEIYRLPCFVQDHEQADAIAKKLEADVMIWGQAYCNPMANTEVHQLSVTNEVRDVRVEERAQANVGNVDVHVGSKPFTICPKATLTQSERSFRRSTERGMDLASVGHLDLPALMATEPFGLVEFALGTHFYGRKNYWLAARFYKRSAEKVLAGERNVWVLHRNLGFVYLHLPDWELSLQHSRLALEQVRGTGSAEEGGLLNNIGEVLRQQGKLDEALEHHRKALVITKELLGPEHPLVGTALSNIGEVLRQQGKLGEALEHHRKALVITKKALGPEHLNVGHSMGNIGVVLDAQGKLEEALEYHRKAFEITKKALGSEHPDVGTALSNIGNVLSAQGKLDEALEHFRKALVIFRKALGSEHPDMGTALSNIGNVLSAQGKLDEALEYHRKAFEITKKALGSEHPDVGTALGNIGTVLWAQGKLDEALEHYRKALEIRKKALGAEHLDVGTCMNNIGMALKEQGKLDEALEHLRRALAIIEKVLGPEHPNVSGTLNNIGGVLSAQGKLDEALEHYRKALAIFEKSLGPQHPNTRTVRENLAFIQAKQNGWDPDPKHNPNQRGTIVLNCLKDTCKSLEPGDWLKTYGTTPIRNTTHLIELVQKTTPSQTISLTLIRNRKPLTLQVPGGRLGIEIQ